MQFIKGQKLPLAQLGLDLTAFDVVVRHHSSLTTDVAVFGLDECGKLSDEDYMTFYNQPTSPCGAVAVFDNVCKINLSLLPPKIHTLTLVISIDGQGMAKDLAGLTVVFSKHGQTVATFTPNDLHDEKAVMLVSIYKKGDWRVSAVGQGFDGGLARLIEHFGGEVADEPVSVAPTPKPSSTTTIELKKKLSLEKAQKTGNKSIIDLTKKSLMTLEKKGLLDVKARVALVLDASGSMNWQYKNGDVQKVVNRLMPLAINFDDDGSFECWAFAQYTTQLDDVTLTNVNHFVNTTKGGYQSWQVGARINEEIPAIQAVINHYSAIHDDVPTYVLFISDGGVGSGRQMQKILTECSSLPIFWQFVGVGGCNYGVLEKLDIMTGRVVDNCNFFALDRIDSIDDGKLYELLLAEFPAWLDEIKRKNLLTNRVLHNISANGSSLFGRLFG